jgi:hypothetical protein
MFIGDYELTYKSEWDPVRKINQQNEMGGIFFMAMHAVSPIRKLQNLMVYSTHPWCAGGVDCWVHPQRCIARVLTGLHQQNIGNEYDSLKKAE